jgi:Rrf2 family protein
MRLTRGADYALRIMIYMAGLPEGQRVGRAAIAAVTEVPEAYLAKILQHLVKARLIRSRPGVGGGFQASRAPANLSMLEVIEAVEGPASAMACIPDGSACDRSPWCGIRQVLNEAQNEVTRILRSASVAELAERSSVHHCAPIENRVLTPIVSVA